MPETSLDEVIHYTQFIIKGSPITVCGDDSQTWDFIYVKDVAIAHIPAADIDKKD